MILGASSKNTNTPPRTFVSTMLFGQWNRTPKSGRVLNYEQQADEEEPMLSGEAMNMLSLENASATLASLLPAEEEQHMKRKQSLEATSVNTGFGCGQEKTKYIQAFYSAVWPLLQGAGWTLVS